MVIKERGNTHHDRHLLDALKNGGTVLCERPDKMMQANWWHVISMFYEFGNKGRSLNECGVLPCEVHSADMLKKKNISLYNRVFLRKGNGG